MFPIQPKFIENSVHMMKPIADQENLSMSKFVTDNSKMFSEPKVRNLVVLAVHKVISDTGLVLICPGSGQKIDRPSLPYDWSSSSPVILCYSLPQLLLIGHDSNPYSREVVFVMFETFGSRFLEANGALLKGNSILNLYKLYLCKQRFKELLVFRCSGTRADSNEKFLKSFFDKRVSHFWKIVKDKLALPLLIDLCYSTGLSLPPCLMSLPPDLKLKILELLPGADIARTACVFSKMRDVAFDDYLWKKKVREEFGVVSRVKMTWKKTFHWCWECRKRPNSCIQEVGRKAFSRVYKSYYGSYRRRGLPAAAASVYWPTVDDDDDDDDDGIWL